MRVPAMLQPRLVRTTVDCPFVGSVIVCSSSSVSCDYYSVKKVPVHFFLTGLLASIALFCTQRQPWPSRIQKNIQLGHTQTLLSDHIHCKASDPPRSIGAADCGIRNQSGVTSHSSVPVLFRGASSQLTQAMPALANSSPVLLLPMSRARCRLRSGSWPTSKTFSPPSLRRHFSSFFDVPPARAAGMFGFPPRCRACGAAPRPSARSAARDWKQSCRWRRSVFQPVGKQGRLLNPLVAERAILVGGCAVLSKRNSIGVS